MEIYIDICEVSEILKVSVVTARKLAGDPDKVTKTKYNLPLFLYDKKRIVAIAEERKAKSICKLCERCRICHSKLAKDDLVGGRCKQCRADFCVINFCQNRCCFCPVNPEMIECLKKAIKKFENGEIKCCFR